MTEQRRERASKALALRREGASYSQIAQELRVSTTTAFDDVDKALKEITREPAEDVLKLELERLDSMFFRLSTQIGRVNRSLAKEQEKGTLDLKGVDALRRLIGTQITVSERRARMLGLDTQRQEIVMDGADAIREALGTIVSTPDEELLAMIEGDAPDTEV